MLPIRWPSNLGGLAALGLFAAAALVVWLGILPRMGQLGPIRTTIDRNESLGIDPTAKFYTELPLTPDTTWRMERLQQEVGRGP